ncbi:MAG TPA: vitamin K epoxide reductase family protein [Candidatus Saccharimonadales bacterium]|nr:vitamin K epoxide reductase family protein [Candidatus Saccharimonadales bacterium]
MSTAPSRLAKVLPWLLLIGGAIGLICSFVISLDKQKLAQNPSFRPNCDLNPIVSCFNVMKSHQGSVFGFSNPWIGLAAFAALMTVAVALLAGGRFKRWFWQGLEAGMVFGMVFAYWLLYESVYTIRALCPYCLVVDVVVTTMFWYTTLYLAEQHMLPAAGGARATKAVAWSRQHHLDLLLLWFLIVIFFVVKHFWYYFGSHL